VPYRTEIQRYNPTAAPESQEACGFNSSTSINVVVSLDLTRSPSLYRTRSFTILPHRSRARRPTLESFACSIRHSAFIELARSCITIGSRASAACVARTINIIESTATWNFYTSRIVKIATRTTTSNRVRRLTRERQSPPLLVCDRA
jgi:hypothetical protein